jgi:hypothetical protein
MEADCSGGQSSPMSYRAEGKKEKEKKKKKKKKKCD